MRRGLPNFFIVGTGKAGSTSLYHYLKQHPQIFMSPVKEPCYFASEVRPENLSEMMRQHVARQSLKLDQYIKDGKPFRAYGWLFCELEDYTRLFQDAGDAKAIGEASVSYLWSKTAARNIHSLIPEAKIIMILRNPAERAFSQYFHQVAAGLTRSSFREHIEESLRRAGGEISIWHPFLEVGSYYEQVKRYFDLFGCEKIRMYWYETDWQQPSRLFRDLFEFLDVDAAFEPDTSRKHLVRRSPRFVGLHHTLKKHQIWQPLKALVPVSMTAHVRRIAFRRDSPRMDPEDRAFLIDYYRADIEKLACLVKRDLSDWLR